MKLIIEYDPAKPLVLFSFVKEFVVGESLLILNQRYTIN